MLGAMHANILKQSLVIVPARFKFLLWLGLFSFALASGYADMDLSSISKIPLFENGKEGCAVFRIPGIVVTNKGTVLAYCEARMNGPKDFGEIEVRLRRSTDGGKTWETARRIAHLGKRIEGNPWKPVGGEKEQTVNNPVAIVERRSGAVHFLYCVNYARCFYMRSDDDGMSFSAPVEITSTFEKFRPGCNWQVLATGPGHGIELKNGRLVVPVWLATGKPGDHHPSVATTIFSDDSGKTWHAGEIAAIGTPEFPDPNETAAVQLADGRVMLNIRSYSISKRRMVTTSPDGATRWTPPHADEALLEPVSMASLVRLSESPGNKNRILFCNPNSLRPRTNNPRACYRENLTVKLSYDEGMTWPVSKRVEEGTSGYSDIAALPDGQILCFYESVGKLTLARFRLQWLTDGADAFPNTATAVHK